MPSVGELYGYPFGSNESISTIKEARCRYTGLVCDGGGNRDMAAVQLSSDSGFRSRYSPEVISNGSVSCAVCSVSMKDGLKIICPRRLLNFGQTGFATEHKKIVALIASVAGFSPGATVGYWTELSLNFKSGKKKFQYRLDYLLRERAPDGTYGPPIIVEVMTCSTSGGNRNLGTDIQTAFRRAVLAAPGDEIACPGINIRQVWARMASQMIVKSEAALYWGGRTIWVVQHPLSDYMGNNTGLNLSEMKSDAAGEVNVIASDGEPQSEPVLYSGPISSALDGENSFSDILRAPFLPSREDFIAKIPAQAEGHFQI